MTARAATRRAVAVAAAAAVLGAGWIALHSGPALAEAVQVWRGYYTLAVSSDSPELPGRLEEAGLGPVVAAATANEMITTFRGTELVPVAGLDRRLDPLDPRYDPYLQEVGEWFAAGPGGRGERIVYVASSLPPASFAAFAVRALSGSGVRWQIAGLPWRGLALALLWYVAAAAAMIVPRRGAAPRGWRAVIALPWLFLVAQGGLVAAFVAIPAHVALARLAGLAAAHGAAAPPRTYRSGRGGAAVSARGVGLAALAAAAAAAVAALASATPAGALIVAMARYLAIGSLWSAALTACAALAGALPPRWPPAARRSPATGAGLPPYRVPLAARLCGGAALAATVAALLLPAAGAHVPRPDPAAAGGPVTLAAMARFSPGAEPHLPVLADYVTHLAYQQTLAVGRPYRLPEPGERVTVDHYRRTADGRVAREQREVARFTEEWLAAALADAPDGSVASLLAAQGRLVAARRGPPPPRATGETALWIAVAVLLCAWLIDPLPGIGRRPAPNRGSP